jgi:hypothetical protein
MPDPRRADSLRLPGVSGEHWRTADVLHAEEALAAAVRTADDIIADATAEPEPPAPPAEEPETPTILHDAW